MCQSRLLWAPLSAAQTLLFLSGRWWLTGWWELKPRVMCEYCWQQVAALSVSTKEAACFVPHLDFGKKRNVVCLVNHLARMFC